MLVDNRHQFPHRGTCIGFRTTCHTWAGWLPWPLPMSADTATKDRQAIALTLRHWIYMANMVFVHLSLLEMTTRQIALVAGRKKECSTRHGASHQQTLSDHEMFMPVKGSLGQTKRVVHWRSEGASRIASGIAEQRTLSRPPLPTSFAYQIGGDTGEARGSSIFTASSPHSPLLNKESFSNHHPSSPLLSNLPCPCFCHYCSRCQMVLRSC